MGTKNCKILTTSEKEETDSQTTNQTLEDLKAIDEDIEKLRKQIEERDKIISALREAAEAKDKKLDNLMIEYNKVQSNGKLDLDTSPEPNRATSSSPSSPPLCNGELCWTDNFVNKNYHEPVYAQLLNDHAALQKIYNELRAKLEAKEEAEKQKTETENNKDGEQQNAINLIMAEQIKALKEREAQLIWEAEELREQNDLMEFRILELEECRKEFLDKEMNEGKHRPEKIVWRERDLEEVSDSGVMSLPTSEDLTSDSELGDAIRNYSPLGAVTNLSPSHSDNSQSDPGGITDLKLKKSLKSADCLQESGIFVDTEPSDCAISKACQTESVLDKTLLDIIDTSCDLFLSKNPGYLEDPKSDDLTTEISKLSVIQKKIQQKTKSPTPTPTPTPAPRNPHTVVCPHSKSVSFYEERLSQLEEKLKIYESSGDSQDILLAKRLQKEVELAHRVKELTDKVQQLESNNKKLEEEKCEFEEAENDTRFQCQRLEIKLQELIDKNTELELELERQKVIMTEERKREKKKGSLEGLMSKYEQRNFELEEQELEAKQRLSMLEAAMPAILAYNVFKMVQNPEITNGVPPVESENLLKEKILQNKLVSQRLEEALENKKSKKKLEESDTEKALRSKILELESKAAKDREMIEEMTNTLRTYKSTEKSEEDLGSLRPDDVDLFEELKQMVANEIQLRAQIERLEKKEEAYMFSLERADDIWAGMEADYKKRLSEAEEANKELQTRVEQLEKTQTELEKALSEQPFQNGETSDTSVDVHFKIQQLMLENEKLKREINKSLDEKFEEHRKFLESENASLKTELRKMELDSAKEVKKYQILQKELEVAREELRKERMMGDKLRQDFEFKSQSVTSMENHLQSQISELTQELTQKSKELSNLEVTVAELREEVETLENKVAELVETIQTTVKNQEEVTTQCSQMVESATQVETLAQENATSQASFISEIEMKYEFEPPRVEILVPTQYKERFLVFFFPYIPRQEMKFLFPISSRVSLKNSQDIIKTNVFELPKSEPEPEPEPKPTEDEIFQLSLKNTELLQILERLEEESKAKDKEFEELQKIALEIRQEQESLASLYGALNKPEKTENKETVTEDLVAEVQNEEPRQSPPLIEEPKTSQSIDILQIFNPIVIKTSEQVSTSLSSLQIALANLRSKYRSTDVIIKPYLDELQQKGDNREIEDFVKHWTLDYDSNTCKKEKYLEGHDNELLLNPEKKEIVSIEKNETVRGKSSDPNPLGKSPSTTCAMLLYAPTKRLPKATESEPEFSYTAPITMVRKIGEDGLFLEWDVSHQPQSVTGFEVKVNGLLSHQVRSSTRNKALLRPLNLNDKITIHLYAISQYGRSTKSSHVTYPNDNFL